MRTLGNKVLRALWPCFAVLAIGVLADRAGAQVTSAQQSAIKASCRSDFMAKCSGVTPGGKDALACLQKNVDRLSSACKTAVSATLPPPATAPKAAAPAASDTAQQPASEEPAATETDAAPATAAPAAPAPAPKAAAVKPAAPTAAQQSAVKQACRSDFMAKCSGVTPGGKDALVCLQRNVAGLSQACKQVVSATMGGAPAAAGAAPATAAAVAPAAGPTPDQLKAVKFTCRRDFIRNCRGIEPGGPEALACLQRNGPRLTPDCRTSLAALGEAAPAAAATAPGSTTTVIIEERRPLPPGITPAGRILRRAIERNE
jgi:Cysteine rich repeat